MSTVVHGSSTPSAPSPLAFGPGDGEADPDLASLPAPPRRERRLTAAVMASTLVASVVLAFALRGEVRYALSSSTPVEVGDLSRAAPPELENRYVHATGLIATVGAIRYERLLEGDSFRLAPLAGNPRVWVEVRVPEGMEGPKFAPPTSFVGRLVPFGAAGIRHAGLASSVAAAGGVAVPRDAYLLIDGASPRASRWSIAMVALLGYFAAWNALGLARMFKKVRDPA